jgi:dienelactone hydrolase
MSKLATLLLLLIVISSCNSNSSASQAATSAATPGILKKDSLEPGMVIPSIALRDYPGQAFALYLPKTYSDSAKLPVIIFFDPHGDGTVPLNLYKDLAEQFQYILIGSNSSKNGMDLQQCTAIADNLVTEAEARFHVNQNKIAFCGFSGGAKVALLAAAGNAAVTSVIYCGAAAPLNTSHKLDLLGFAGTRDMNYTDVVAFDQSIKGSPHIHYLIEWNGKHEFPKPEVFKDAFQFLSTSTIEDYTKKHVTITQQKLIEEQIIKQQLIPAFQTQDLNWWKQEIAQFNTKKKNDVMYERLLGFISLACYSYSNQALQQNNLPIAEKILAIYALADPGNTDCAKFTEELMRRKASH